MSQAIEEFKLNNYYDKDKQAFYHRCLKCGDKMVKCVGVIQPHRNDPRDATGHRVQLHFLECGHTITYMLDDAGEQVGYYQLDKTSKERDNVTMVAFIIAVLIALMTLFILNQSAQLREIKKMIHQQTKIERIK